MGSTRSPALSARSMSISSASGPTTSSHRRSGSRTEYSALTSHGMPKEPSLLSPNSLVTPHHRFSGLPPSPRPSYSEPRSPFPPMSPMPALSPSTPRPKSPPMSAKSFGTLIDSEPSTPAYSPHQGSSWDGSTLVLLPHVKAGDVTPGEPAWDMLVPLQKPPKKRFSRHKAKSLIGKEMAAHAHAHAPVPSHPVVSIQEEEPQKEKHVAAEEEQGTKEGEREKKEEEQPPQDSLGKLTSRVKNLLKRKNPAEKKERKRNYYEIERVETVHWTEL
ncbi:hypothetical protein PMIN06_011495 [Paraphaeosphaeria minitans]